MGAERPERKGDFCPVSSNKFTPISGYTERVRMRAQHMEIFIADQIKTMAESCLLGLIFGVGYDIIRIAYILCHVATYRGTCEKPVPHTKGAFALFFGLDFSYLLVVTFFFSVFFVPCESRHLSALSLSARRPWILYLLPHHRTARDVLLGDDRSVSAKIGGIPPMEADLLSRQSSVAAWEISLEP